MTDQQADLAEIVGRMAARAQIHDIMMRYARGIDHRDAALTASCYHPGAIDDHGFYQGSAEGFVVAAIEAGAAFTNMRHIICNEYVEFDTADPALAYSETVVLACMTNRPDGDPDGDQRLAITACRFLDRFAERDGAWRIVHRRVVLDWDAVLPTTGNQGSDMTIGMLRGLASMSDPSFGLGFRRSSEAPAPPVSEERALG